MEIAYSPSANELKLDIRRKYAGIDAYFAELERSIEQSPYEAAEEKIVIEGKPFTAYKRSAKTGLFSGNFPTSYLYLSMSYAIEESIGVRADSYRRPRELYIVEIIAVR